MPEFRNRIVEYGVKNADQFTANPKNARIHPQFQRDVMKAALDSLGWIAPVIEAKKSGYLVDGHERIMQALVNNDPVPYVVVDLDESEEAEALATFDPITGLATYDTSQLDALLKEVNSDSPAIQQMLAQLAEGAGLYQDSDNAPGDPGAALNRAEELREKYHVERGQLWTLGRHRLMCGSSYDADSIALLLDGKTPDMLHTDPPYGINAVNAHIDGKGLTSALKNMPPGESRRGSVARKVTDAAFRSVGATGAMRAASRTALIVQPNLYPVIEGDDHSFDPSPFLTFAPIIILWGANNYADKLPVSRAWLTWDKREGITRNDFSDCELAWCNTGNVSRCFHHLWNGLHKGSQHGERRVHPTEKPVALFEEIGKMYADKGLWCDLFAGSGAQIVAAERSGATCYAMEYEPLYVAVILERMAGMGLTPRLQDGS